MAMIRREQARIPPKLQVGMVDAHINETVTFVAELDEDDLVEAGKMNLKRDCCKVIICAILLPCVLPFICLIYCIACAILLPCVLPFICLIYCIACSQYRTSRVRVPQYWRLHLPDHTLVYVDPDPYLHNERISIPLTNIASVVPDSSSVPSITTINIKPSAPELLLNRGPERITATRSLEIKHVKNAEAFAEIVHGNIR